MSDVIGKILSSEFFWGIIIGVILSLVSAFAATKYQSRQNKIEKNELVRKFLTDCIENVSQYSQQLSDNRDRNNNVIDHEFLNLMEVEINIYGRNREHLVCLKNNDLRKNVITYFNKISSSIIRIRFHLAEFQKYYNSQVHHENQLSASNLQEANKRCDALILFITTNSTSLIGLLKNGNA